MSSQIRLVKGHQRPVRPPTQISISSPFAGFNSPSQISQISGFPTDLPTPTQILGFSTDLTSTPLTQDQRLPSNARLLPSSFPVARIRPSVKAQVPLTQQQIARMEMNRQIAMGRRAAARSLSQPLPGTGRCLTPGELRRMQRNRQVRILV